MLTTLLIAPPPPPPPPPPPAEVPKVIKPVARLIQQGKLMQPRAIPKEVAVFKEADLPPEAPVNAGGVLGGVDHGLLARLGAVPTVAAPPPPPKQTRIKLGGQGWAAQPSAPARRA